MYVFDTEEKLKDFIRENILTSSEVVEFLGISRARMSTMIKTGKLEPVKKMAKDSLFLKSDIEKKKEELEHLRKKYRPFDEEPS